MSINQQSLQLPLSMQLKDDATLESFYPGVNAEAYNMMCKISSGIGEQFVYIHGKEGVGKTHLLQACCNGAYENQNTAVYINFSSIKKMSPAILAGLEQVSIICLDDIHCLVKIPEFEEALFHLFNAIKDRHGRLIVASNISAANIGIKLPDLKSRLAWGVSYHLELLPDEQKLKALQLRAFGRGLKLSKSVGNYLMSRCSRDMTQLFNTLELLDKASLAEKRALTIPFVKKTLGC
jgi:DnaA-homolog protein